MELGSQPRDYGLPHDTWYPNQQMAVEWAITRNHTNIIEAPTGSGKTGIAAAIASRRKTLALVRTKFLQQENYEMGYGFIPLYGKGNYPCVYEEAKPYTMADECAFAEEGMTRCPQFSACGYCIQRELARQSRRTALNYAYWFHVYNKWPDVENVVTDEAHQLSDLTLSWAGLIINESTRKEYNLPSFPIINNRGNQSILDTKMSANDRARTYLIQVRAALVDAYNEANANKSVSKYRKKARKIERLGKKVRATLDAMKTSEDGWFLSSGPRAGTNGWAFVAKPLTARYHFPKYFMRGQHILTIMSATIGEPNVFAEELGIQNFDFLQIPNSWEPSSRPIYAMDVPRLGRKSPDSAYEKQADEINKAIQGCDPSWSGIIHTTSKAEAVRIAKRLHSRGLHDRIFVSKPAGTDDMVSEWHRQLKFVPNSVLVSWALWEGYDGTQEKINIAAKTPYPYLGDQYERERQRFDGKFFLQRTAWTLEQGLGRTRRGKKEDYDLDGETNGFVAIADGGWKWIRSYLSKSTLESIL